MAGRYEICANQGSVMRRFIEANLFKKRVIVDYDAHTLIASPAIKIVEMDTRPELNRYGALPGALPALIARRAGSPAWILFLFIDEQVIAGYAFLHRPGATEWFDSLPTLAGEARSCSHYTQPEMRGRGIIGQLLSAQRTYLGNSTRLWAVIESGNRASVAAALKSGRVRSGNCLVKIIRRNILSVTTSPFRTYILIGARRASR